jgi:hypothetical protein
VDHLLARRGIDVGMREALGAITRYIVLTWTGRARIGTRAISQAVITEDCVFSNPRSRTAESVL